MDTHGIEKVLACPYCHGALAQQGDTLRCSGPVCGFRAVLSDGIVNVSDFDDRSSFFDARFPIMMHSSEQRGSNRAFYAQQVEALRDRLSGAKVILDVGCGPRLIYKRPSGNHLLIGIDASYESLTHNKDVDIRVYGSAVRLPLPSRSIDAVVCFYSLHHFVGRDVGENEAFVRAAMGEFARVLTPKGSLLVFEVAPLWPVWAIQRLIWNFVKRDVVRSFDMFFWTRQALVTMASEHFPAGAALEYVPFKIPALTTFPPAFALRRVRLPRLLYPFHICMYHWRMASA